jgi:predicted nuclease of predicted toxin-antitoxin system
MPRFLIDANLPYRFAVWRGEAFVHVFDLGESWSDLEIWRYAQENDLAIVTKDADFSDWVMLSEPPPKVIHLRIGNMRMRDFHQLIQKIWPEVSHRIESHKLIIVYANKIECVAQ